MTVEFTEEQLGMVIRALEFSDNQIQKLKMKHQNDFNYVFAVYKQQKKLQKIIDMLKEVQEKCLFG